LFEVVVLKWKDFLLWVLGAGYWMLDTGYWMLDDEFAYIFATISSIQHPGSFK
jgi:hypothetical protein